MVPQNITPARLSNRYQILSVLGDGGFGQTFLVKDTQMPSERRCVLKQLKPINDNPQIHNMVKTRFQREAAILEKLGESHSQVPSLYAYFEEAGQFYLVEEWIEGDTLTQRLQKEGKQSEAATKEIIANLLPAIAYVHAQGIVHRDVKPDNVILRKRDDLPVLIDFGAVKETMSTVVNSQGNSSHSIVVGTPGYMPAEQLSGRPIYASDLYSLGMTAIYLLTGKIPQELETNPMSGILQWQQYAPSLSPGFANFLNCAINMSTQHRFATVEQMLSALEPLLNGQGTVAPAQNNHTKVSKTVISAPPPSPAVVTPQDVYTSSKPAAAQQSAPWKSAIIIGGLIGASILGSAILIQKLPSAAQPEPNPDTIVSEPAPPAEKAPEPNPQPEEEEKKPVTSTPPSTPSSAPAPAPTPAPPARKVTPNANATVGGQTGNKNIRSGPGTNSSVVDSVRTGDRVRMIQLDKDSEGYPWYQVVTPNGVKGWIAGQLLQIDGDIIPREPPKQTAQTQPTSPSPRDRTNAVIVGSGSKNIRSGPGTKYSVKHTASPGDRIIIHSQSQDSGGYTWYQISLPKAGAEGWIAAQLVQLD